MFAINNSKLKFLQKLRPAFGAAGDVAVIIKIQAQIHDRRVDSGMGGGKRDLRRHRFNQCDIPRLRDWLRREIVPLVSARESELSERQHCC